MKHNIKLKQKAIILRKKGLSYSEIQKQLPVAKSTLSVWLKDILLAEKHRKRLYSKQIALLTFGSQSQKARREREVAKIISEAKQEIKFPLSFETYRFLGAALYWAEGSKGKRCAITNSDPYLILFMVKWIEKMFNIAPKHLKARLNIYPQQNENNIKKFWSDITKIPLENFGKSYIKPISSGYKSNNLYYGTMRIDIPKSTNYKHRIFGWIQAVMDDIEPHINHTQKRWISLSQTPRPINLQNS